MSSSISYVSMVTDYLSITTDLTVHCDFFSILITIYLLLFSCVVWRENCLICGGQLGTLSLLDCTTLNVINSVKSHTGEPRHSPIPVHGSIEILSSFHTNITFSLIPIPVLIDSMFCFRQIPILTENRSIIAN